MTEKMLDHLLESLCGVAFHVFDMTHDDWDEDEPQIWVEELLMHYFARGELYSDLEIRRRSKQMMQDLADRL